MENVHALEGHTLVVYTSFPDNGGTRGGVSLLFIFRIRYAGRILEQGDQFIAAVHLKFGVDIPQVCFDSMKGNEEGFGNFLIAISF